MRYLVIKKRDGSFLGMADARQTAANWQKMGSTRGYDDFAKWLIQEDIQSLSSLAGFMSSKYALQTKTSKRVALQLMDSLDVQTLPVVDEANQFVGIVDRARLTASMLIDISQRLESTK